jgi:fructokinase
MTIIANGRIAGLELGGTKAIALLWQDGQIIADHRVPTSDPDSTFAGLLPAFAQWWQDGPFDALGIASFGPVALERTMPDYGHIRTTPKPGWSGAPIISRLSNHFPCPIAIETDVNAAALAETRWGSGVGATSLIYLTIGTGVGGGVLVNGAAVHGRLHPELGHISLRRAPEDIFSGTCPFHADCVEGLLSGPALAARFGMPAEAVDPAHPDWQYVAHDLAQFLATLIHSLAPNRILIGGGAGLGLSHVRAQALAMLPDMLGGYYPDLDAAALEAMIRPPGLGDLAGPLGAIAIGLQELGR